MLIAVRYRCLGPVPQLSGLKEAAWSDVPRAPILPNFLDSLLSTFPVFEPLRVVTEVEP